MRNKIVKVLPLALAAALQVMPMLRTVLPEAQALAPSTWAFVLQLAAGAVALLGGVHAVSGASVYINGVGSPKSFTISGTNGVSMTPLRLTTGGQTASSWSTTTAPLNSAVYPLAPGLFLTNATGYIGGKPTQTGTNTYAISAWENSGNSGATISTNFTFAISSGSVTATKPGVASPPAGLNLTAGQPANFSVIVTGTPALYYQWRKNFTNYLAGAAGTNYLIANAHLADVGSYDVVITNSAGSITSAVAMLTVNAPASPTINPTAAPTGQFQFTFIPVVGLTNIILTNNLPRGVGWNIWTNILPPTSASSITVTDVVMSAARFYRVEMLP